MNIVNPELLNIKVEPSNSFKGKEGYSVSINPCFVDNSQTKRRPIISFFADAEYYDIGRDDYSSNDFAEIFYIQAYLAKNKKNEEIVRYSSTESSRDKNPTIIMAIPFRGKIQFLKQKGCEILTAKIISTPIPKNKDFKKRQKMTLISDSEPQIKCEFTKYLLIVANVFTEGYSIDTGVKIITVNENSRENEKLDVKKVNFREDFISFGINSENKIPNTLMERTKMMSYIPDFNSFETKNLTSEQYEKLKEDLKLFKIVDDE